MWGPGQAWRLARYQSISDGGRSVVVARRFAGELGGDAVGQLLAELDAPLVEAVDPPHDALDEHEVLVESDQLTEYGWCEFGRHDRGRRPVAGERAPWLVGPVAPERQSLGLGNQVGDEQVMMFSVGVVRVAKPMKSAGTISVP